MTGNDGPTIEDVASVTGETPEELRSWQRLGLLGDEPLATAAIERARLVRFAAKRGVRPGHVARICHEHGDVLASRGGARRPVRHSG